MTSMLPRSLARMRTSRAHFAAWIAPLIGIMAIGCASSRDTEMERQLEALRAEIRALQQDNRAEPPNSPPEVVQAPPIMQWGPTMAVGSATAPGASDAPPAPAQPAPAPSDDARPLPEGPDALPIVKLSPPPESPRAFEGPAPIARALSDEPSPWSTHGPEVIVLPDHGLSEEADAWQHGAYESDPNPIRSPEDSVATVTDWEQHVVGLSDAGEPVVWPTEAAPAPSPRSPAQSSQPPAPKAHKPAPMAPTPLEAAAPPPRDDAQLLYDSGMQALQTKRYAEADAALAQLVHDHPAHHLADNAQYWRAEVEYDQRRFDSALTGFRAVVERFPLGNKVPDAMVKMGLCFRAMGSEAAARDMLEQVVRLYPHTEASKVAQERIHRP